MKTFYFTHHRYYQPKLARPLNFFLLSDLHFSHLVKTETLNAITKLADSRHPDYIIFTGDLVDCQEEVHYRAHRDRLLNWLQKLADIAPLFLIPGNHDYYLKAPGYKSGLSTKRHWLSATKPALLKEIRQLNNVRYLVNDAYEDDNLYLLGLNASPAYYQLDADEDHCSTIFHPGFEDKAELIKNIRALPAALREDLPTNKAKLLLFHSPIYLQDPEITKYFKEFDHYLSGHMHNGCVPPLLNELWKSNRGIFGPGKTIGPDHVRARIKEDEDHNRSIVLGAITTVQKCAKPISFLNAIYPVNVAELILTPNPAHKQAELYSQYQSYK